MFNRVLMRSVMRPMMLRKPLMGVMAQRTYLKDLGLDSESLALA